MPYNTKNRCKQGQALRKEIYMYNSGKTSLSEMVDDLEKKHHIRICDDYKELIKRYGV